jgi:hypothetical protein
MNVKNSTSFCIRHALRLVCDTAALHLKVAIASQRTSRQMRVERPIRACLTLAMRSLLHLIICLGLIIGGGCGGKKSSQTPALTGSADISTNAFSVDSKFTVLPEEGMKGKVVWLNASLRFVVLTFPLGQVPTLDQRLSVYRNGSRVGELKVTGPQRDENTVADIVSGEAQKDDDVREK